MTRLIASLNRETATSNLAELIDLLERVRPDRQWQLIDTIRGLAWRTDDEHARVAEVCADALRAETDHVVPLPPVSREGSGLPPHFERIARAACT